MSGRRQGAASGGEADLLALDAVDANEILIVGAGFEAARRKHPLTACPDYGGNTRWQRLWRAGHHAWSMKDESQ